MHITVFFTINLRTYQLNFLLTLLSISYCNYFWLLSTAALSSAYLISLIVWPPTEIPVSSFFVQRAYFSIFSQ